MRSEPIPWRRVTVCCLLVVSAVAVAAPGHAAAAESGSVATPENGTAPSSTAVMRDAERLDRRYVMSLAPDHSGEVRVELRFRVPDRVTGLTATLPGNTTVEATRGFTRSDDRTYEWTTATDEPRITYRVQVNESVARGIEGGTSGGYVAVATGSWAILPTPRTDLRISGTGRRPTVNTTYGIDGAGTTGDGMAYLGPHRLLTRGAGGQRIDLVVPAAADMAARPAAVLGSLADAARTLEIGPRDDRVVAIAAPTTVEWGSAGLQRGPADFWVRDDRRLDTPDNVWLHEYVHTRQPYLTAAETRWTIEGMADYYAARLTFQQGRIDYERFRRHLERGRANRYDDVTLVAPDSWRGTMAAYDKGALAFAAIDRRIRTETDRAATLDAAVRQFNVSAEMVTHEEFLAAVRNVGGNDARDVARTYTETTAAPETWNRSAHRRDFEGVTVTYAFEPPYERGGPYRNDTAGAAPAVVTGETLALRVAVENTGDDAGEYRVAVRADGDRVAIRSGRLAAGARETVTVSRTFTDPGDVRISAGGASETVTVRRPADVRVVSLDAPRRVRVGAPVDVTATVGGSATRPADGTVSIRAGERTVVERRVRLDADETTPLTGTVRFDEAGEYAITAGDRTRAVRVVERSTADGTTARDTGPPSPVDERSTTSRSPTTDGSGAGFGAITLLVALAALVAGACRR